MTSWVLTIPEHLKTEKMCNEAVRINLLSLEYVPDHFKVQEMCNEVVRNKLCMLLLVPDHFWTQEMCNEIMRTMPGVFHRIHDRFKTQEMCDKAVKDDSSSLQFIPDWFASTEWVDMWCDDYYDDDGDHWDDDGDEDHFFEWYDGSKPEGPESLNKRRALTIAWHPSRMQDWWMSEDEKGDAEKFWLEAWTFCTR